MFRETTAQSPWPLIETFSFCKYSLHNHCYNLIQSVSLRMANRVTKTPTLRPGHYAAKLAKALEDEVKAKNRSRHKDAAGCESKSSGSIQMGPESHNGSKVIHQSDRETELVDSSPDRLHQSTTHANNRLVNEANVHIFLFLNAD
jgi:hypothetical protein